MPLHTHQRGINEKSLKIPSFDNSAEHLECSDISNGFEKPTATLENLKIASAKALHVYTL